MYPKYLYEQINVFFKNGIVHHARIDYKQRIYNNQFVKKSDYVYRSEIKNRLRDISDYCKQTVANDFNIKEIIVHRNYENLTADEIENEEYLKDHRKDRYFHNSSLGIAVDKIKDDMYSLDVLLHKINLRMVAWITVGSLVVGGIGYTLCTSFKPKKGTINMATSAIETMMTFDNPHLDIYNIDTVLAYIDDIASTDFETYSNGLMVCNDLLGQYRPNTREGLIVFNRFNTICGLKSNGRNSENALRRICMYGINLVMGGDDYHGKNKTMVYAMKFSGLKLDEYEEYARVLQAGLEKGNLPLDRIMYSADTWESEAYRRLPPIIRYIILSRTEMAFERTKFEFNDNERPIWLFKNADETYSYEELLEIIRTEKEKCRQEIYTMYSTNAPKKR